MLLQNAYCALIPFDPFLFLYRTSLASRNLALVRRVGVRSGDLSAQPRLADARGDLKHSAQSEWTVLLSKWFQAMILLVYCSVLQCGTV